MSSCEEVLVLSAGSCRATRKLEVRARDLASATEEFETYSLPDGRDFLCLGDVEAAAEDDWVAVAQSAVPVMERKSQRLESEKSWRRVEMPS